RQRPLVALDRDHAFGAFREERARETAGARPDFVHRRARDVRLACDPARQVQIEDEILPECLLGTQPVCGDDLAKRRKRVERALAHKPRLSAMSAAISMAATMLAGFATPR